ncbi:MAG: hypothetical protein AAFY71_08485 [Bacteroidota bacterium]
MKRWLILLCLSAFLFQACRESHEERILFSSGRNGNTDIFMMNGEGEEIKAITHSQAEEWAPSWINRDEISFLRQNEAGIHRIKLNLNNQTETSLPHPKGCILDDKNALYNPHTGQELYMCHGNIFVTNGDQPINLTDHIEGECNYPIWTRDGKGILLTLSQQGNQDIYLMNLNSKRMENLTHHPANDQRADLSPDGKYLVFCSDRFNQNAEIVLQHLESGKVMNLSQHEGFDLIARWSLDGERIYYGSRQDNNWDIYSYDMKTRERTRLTKHQEFDGDPRIF